MKSDFGYNVKILRKQHGLTQQQLGDILKVSAQAVSKWETGGGYPDVALIPQIADMFGVTTDELLRCKERQSTEKIADRLDEEQATDEKIDMIMHTLGDVVRRLNSLENTKDTNGN